MNHLCQGLLVPPPPPSWVGLLMISPGFLLFLFLWGRGRPIEQICVGSSCYVQALGQTLGNMKIESWICVQVGFLLCSISKLYNHMANSKLRAVMIRIAPVICLSLGFPQLQSPWALTRQAFSASILLPLGLHYIPVFSFPSQHLSHW